MNKETRFSGRTPIPSVPKKSDEMAELIALAKDESCKEEKEIYLGAVPNHQGQFINEKTAIKTNGFNKTVSREALSHVIKGHADNKSEMERGQKGVCESDFLLIPSILVAPDNVECGSKNRRGQDVIKFIKTINGATYYVVMSVKVKKSELSFSTMYIKR